MKASGLLKIVCVGALAAVCSFGLAACGSNSDGTVDVSDTSGGVAATVNGTEIGENAVSDYIVNFRSVSGLEDDAAWAQWLVDNDYTAKDIRAQVIDMYVGQELIRQAAKENDVTVEESEMDAQVETMRAYYETDEEWQQALESIGATDATYREQLELSLIETALMDKVAKTEDPSEKELVEYCQMYSSMYDGAKKSSHILVEDEKTAKEVLKKIESGDMTFKKAAAKYSKDTGSAEDGGNVGWDVLTTFVDEYQTALDGLSKGEMSGPVASDYGVHIIKCTDVFNAPEEITSSDQMPKEFLDTIKESLASSSKQAAYTEWYEGYEKKAKIDIKDAPKDLEYAVSLEGMTKSSDTEAAEGEAVEVEE